MVRNLVLGAFALILGFWSYIFYERTTEHDRALQVRDERIAELTSTVEAQTAEIQRREVARQLMRLNHRIARIEVLEQAEVPGKAGTYETTVLFTELHPNGAPIGEGQTITIEGRQLYIDTHVVKFEDDFVEQGDELRGTSVCLFQRLFSDTVAPKDGVPLDAAKTHPLPFQGDQLPDPVYAELFERIWDYANNPDEAAKLGVRAIHGDAPSIEARPGRTYQVELRQSDGLSIRAID